MIIECRKGKKAFSRLIFQPLQKAKNCFLLLYHCNRNRQISFRNLLANQRFAVEILEFRLSIVVINISSEQKNGCLKFLHLRQPLFHGSEKRNKNFTHALPKGKPRLLMINNPLEKRYGTVKNFHRSNQSSFLRIRSTYTSLPCQ